MTLRAAPQEEPSDGEQREAEAEAAAVPVEHLAPQHEEADAQQDHREQGPAVTGERLADRAPPALLGDEDHPRDVEEDAAAAGDRQHDESDAEDDGVDVEVVTQPAAH